MFFLTLKNKSRLKNICFALICSSLLFGCGGSVDKKVTGSLSLTFTYDGKPVKEGDVTIMIVEKAITSVGEIENDGKVNLKNVIAGDYSVIIVPPSNIPEGVDTTAPGYKPPPQKECPDLPKKTRSFSTSTLKVTVKEGKNEYQFELKE